MDCRGRYEDGHLFGENLPTFLMQMLMLSTLLLDYIKLRMLTRLALCMQEAPDLVRAIDCFNDAVMFVDVSQPKWKIMHMNSGAETRLKLHDIQFSTAQGSESCLWDLFRVSGPVQGSANPWDGHGEDIKHGRKFEIPSVIGQCKSNNSAPQPVFVLTFRY